MIWIYFYCPTKLVYLTILLNIFWLSNLFFCMPFLNYGLILVIGSCPVFRSFARPLLSTNFRNATCFFFHFHLKSSCCLVAILFACKNHCLMESSFGASVHSYSNQFHFAIQESLVYII